MPHRTAAASWLSRRSSRRCLTRRGARQGIQGSMLRSAPPQCCNDVLSGSSIRHILRVLRAALQDAVDEELLSRNVARLVQLRGADDRKVRAFTRPEAVRFLKAAEDHRLYALWAAALSMGLRRGEALGLRWQEVDLEIFVKMSGLV
jgi:integrase